MKASICLFICAAGGLLVAGVQVIRRQELEGKTLELHIHEIVLEFVTYITWRYRSENEDIEIVNSQIIRGEDITDYYTDRFRDRLQLNRNSGCIFIKNIRREDSGVYTVHINKRYGSEVSFSVDVYAPVSMPVIKNQPVKCSVSHRQSCSPLCSVENGKDVSLYWNEEKERISSISRADSSERLSLPLNLTNMNSSTYTCVAANPVSYQTVQLNIAEVCSINAVVNQLPGTGESNHSDNSSCSTQCCGSAELMVRLALSAVVVLVTIAILLYHFSSRRASDERQDRRCND